MSTSLPENDTLRALAARKSVRVFTEEPVTEAERAAILQAAFEAPTAGNQQLYTILNITAPALRQKLADLCDHQPMVAAAPVLPCFPGRLPPLAPRLRRGRRHTAPGRPRRFDAGCGRRLHCSPERP